MDPSSDTDHIDFRLQTIETYVKCVKNHPRHIADEEDNDDKNEHFCDSLIPSQSVGRPLVS